MKKFLLLLVFLVTTTTVFSQTVYITKTGEKYHKETCAHLRKSSISITIEEALERGYGACKVCKPGTISSKTSLTEGSENTTTETQSKSSASVQCSGKTKKGARCKRMTTNGNGRCYQH
ncbi:hypothetical protein J2X31_003033 [Flavobacterium arsenatis]|uniref:Uncharacterized protein n=1 Tax=Flavobacterium arsenatis TaxID=1484332 RepID=A0ABU1TT06_9FLAO|nr:hypothetical protein [Flavobacterium arsenatis]MDR6969007.1 hypothetical protein [Flavobacterium arsenatis]